MSDYYKRPVLDRSLFTPLATIRNASISNLNLFHPGCKEQAPVPPFGKFHYAFFLLLKTFVYRAISQRSLQFNQCLFFFYQLRKSFVSMAACPRWARISLIAVFKKLILLTPGISTGYWNARKAPSLCRRLRSEGRIFKKICDASDRADGIFLQSALQYPVEIPGVSNINFLKDSY